MSQQLSPDGRFFWDGAAWQPVPAAPPPPPPAAYAAPPPPPPYAAPAAPPTPAFAPPPGYPPAPPGVAPAAPYAPPAAPYTAPGAPSYGGGDMAFGEVAWNSGFPLGLGYIVRIDDIEAGKSQASNDKLVFTGITIQPNGHIAAGFKGVWSYTLTEKAVGKLGRDMVALNLTSKRYPRDVNALAAALLAELRGTVVIVDAVESKSGDLPNVSIVGRYEGAGPTGHAPPPSPFPPAPPAPVAAAAPPAVSFPSAPPPPPPV